MTTKHTPGPWILTPDTDYRLNVEQLNTGWQVAQVFACDPEGEANAKLIAVAPDLLDALRNLCAVAPRPNSARLSFKPEDPILEQFALALAAAYNVLAKATS